VLVITRPGPPQSPLSVASLNTFYPDSRFPAEDSHALLKKSRITLECPYLLSQLSQRRSISCMEGGFPVQSTISKCCGFVMLINEAEEIRKETCSSVSAVKRNNECCLTRVRCASCSGTFLHLLPPFPIWPSPAKALIIRVLIPNDLQEPLQRPGPCPPHSTLL
jgi:hypothetical protein